MTNQGVSRAFRSRVGLPPLDANGRESVTELDDTQADGPVPTTGGETQPPGSERIGGNNASDLDSPEPTEVIDADVDGQGDQSGDTSGEPFDAVAQAEAKDADSE